MSEQDLEPAIAEPVIGLAGEGDEEIEVHLPFFDRRQWKRRAEILGRIEWVREGNSIRSVMDAGGLARNRAAELVLGDPAWKSTPDETNLSYFPTWQRVSLRLQKALRNWIPELYFKDIARYEDRDAAYPFLVYEASRVCYGRPRTEFAYDVADAETLPMSLRMIGRAMQSALSGVEARLHEAGRPALARRYAPVWHQDILAAVRKRPRKLVELLATDAAVVNAVIDLGTAHSAAAVSVFARTAGAALRSVSGDDMRGLAVRALDEATLELARSFRNSEERGSPKEAQDDGLAIRPTPRSTSSGSGFSKAKT